MFESISKAEADPVLGLMDVFYHDDRLNKINLSIGIYQDEYGNEIILSSVKEAEKLLLKNEKNKNYLNIEGTSDFINCTQRLIFGIDNELVLDGKVCTVQTPGGTGSLRVIADFLVRNTVARRVWISDPSWINHKNVFSFAGFKVCRYPYYNHFDHSLNFKGIIDTLHNASIGDIVVLHGCCHNPTGIDPTVNQWYEIAELLAKVGCLPVFDLAYQGFGRGLKDDVESIHIFLKYHKELVVCNSYSKNFGLYNERVGACSLVAKNKKVVQKALGQLKAVIRANYSNPPSHGAFIVSTILSNEDLCILWKNELKLIRDRIKHMRRLFVQTLYNKGVFKDFNFIIEQCGMFSFINLTKNQIFKLRNQFGVYIVDSGRINIAGINQYNVDFLCESLISVF